ncbi:MAG: hypothetical protein F6K54_17695 [Okeania sp. SIO3B5]|uniref:hypothetical protein n=1 Tax=Okeania sp. SIO3B5 TaxID=2607811 RepID=UPI0013FFBF5B|nr:hypothetical protein [Okeania sp. SIO3B5]NEO54751.1 hypothetical protein [Okeania sp. SIO3B5]
MKCLVIFNPEKNVKSFRISDFPPTNLAELFGNEYELSTSKGYIQAKSYPLKTQENQQNIQDSTNNVLTDYLKLKNRQYGIALTHQHNFKNENWT